MNPGNAPRASEILDYSQISTERMFKVFEKSMHDPFESDADRNPSWEGRHDDVHSSRLRQPWFWLVVVLILLLVGYVVDAERLAELTGDAAKPRQLEEEIIPRDSDAASSRNNIEQTTTDTAPYSDAAWEISSERPVVMNVATRKIERSVRGELVFRIVLSVDDSRFRANFKTTLSNATLAEDRTLTQHECITATVNRVFSEVDLRIDCTVAVSPDIKRGDYNVTVTFEDADGTPRMADFGDVTIGF